jgi:hypothetical protein
MRDVCMYVCMYVCMFEACRWKDAAANGLADELELVRHVYTCMDMYM